MGGSFLVITTLFRSIFLLLVGASITVISATRMTEANQPLFDPFTPYADILLWQSENDIEAHGFRCLLNRIPTGFTSRCLSLLSNRAISEIVVGFSYIGRLTQVAFTLREKLTLGHVILLWGKPEIDIVGELAYFYWSQRHITATASIYNHHISYWLPIANVAFHSAE
jgi:hypothetical protein